MERLQQLAQTEYKIDDRESYVHFIEMDTDFHVGIAQLARNPLLLHAVETVRSQMERIMYAAIDIGYYGELPVREHCGIFDAIRLRDHEAARRLMHDHIFGSEDKVRRLAGGSTR
jgi:DNA-binding FadR family transcriptional regulator